jgi:hypothetical protein
MGTQGVRWASLVSNQRYLSEERPGWFSTLECGRQQKRATQRCVGETRQRSTEDQVPRRGRLGLLPGKKAMGKPCPWVLTLP